MLPNRSTDHTGVIRVGCAQLALDIDDRVGNRSACIDAIQRAAEAGADVMVLPELANTGYAFRDRGEVEKAAERRDGPTVTEWAQAAEQTGCIIVGGFAERSDDGRIYNSAVLIEPTGNRTFYRKAHLWDFEKELFEPGAQPPAVVDTALGRLGVMICYDLEFPEWVRAAALAGVQLLCAPTNWPLFPRPDGERPLEIVKVQANAAINRIAIAACDRVGTERGVSWVGGAVIVDVDGFPVASPVVGEPTTLFADVDIAAARDKAIGPRNDVFADRRRDLYSLQDLTMRDAPGDTQDGHDGHPSGDLTSA